MNIKQYLDSTYLKTASQAGLSDEENTLVVKNAISEAIAENFKLIMIRPEYVALAKEMILKSNSTLLIGTVIDFPEGTSDLESKLKEANKAIEDGADDLDFVCNYQAFKNGDLALVKQEILIGTQIGLASNKTVKWIIEVAALNDKQIIQLSALIKNVVISNFKEENYAQAIDYWKQEFNELSECSAKDNFELAFIEKQGSLSNVGLSCLARNEPIKALEYFKKAQDFNYRYASQYPREKNFIKFASYALFFPKLISGPITRYKNINSQLSTLGPSTNDTAAGLRRILSGVIKRIVIANQVGIVADAVFNMPANGITPGYAWLGLLAYTIQIYFDFSGYTDIALGLAMTMGISLPENFNYPYTAQSISDFWRRWHITLSTWFREYVFFPLERRRLKFVGRQINILVVFLLTGLWHGFSLTFAAWGLIHGISIALESTSAGLWLNKVFRPFRHLYTLSIILLGWVFFRSPDLKFAMAFIGRLFGNSSGISPLPFSQTTPLPFIEPSFLLAMTAGIVFSMPLSSIFTPLKEKLTAKPSVFMAFQITGDILLILLFTFAIAAQLAGSFAPNIYANF